MTDLMRVMIYEALIADGATPEEASKLAREIADKERTASRGTLPDQGQRTEKGPETSRVSP